MTVATAGQSPLADDPRLHAVKTLGKALILLEGISTSEHPPTISEIAVKAGLARPTAYRLVQTLVSAGFLQQNPIDGRLTIGYAVLPLAASLLDRNRLRLEALPHLQALAQKMNERVNLGILHQNRIMILAGCEKPSLPTIYSRFGRMVPVHCCALGKAILAYLPAHEARSIIEAYPMIERTPNTIVSLSSYVKELEAVRTHGYATEHGENSPTSCCVAAPILGANDQPVGAISVSGRSLESLLKDIDQVLGTAEVISHVL